jgi:hypothetical protein
MANEPQIDEGTLRIMRQLLRQPPKPHEKMKVGKKAKKSKPKKKPGK